MTNGSDYSGAITSAKQMYRLMKKAYGFYAGQQLPKDPDELIKFAEKLKKQEALRERGETAKAYITKTLRERKDRERSERRARIKKLFGKK